VEPRDKIQMIVHKSGNRISWKRKYAGFVYSVPSEPKGFPWPLQNFVEDFLYAQFVKGRWQEIILSFGNAPAQDQYVIVGNPCFECFFDFGWLIGKMEHIRFNFL